METEIFPDMARLLNGRFDERHESTFGERLAISIEAGANITGFSCVANGRNNRVQIGQHCAVDNLSIHIDGDDNTISVQSDSKVSDTRVRIHYEESYGNFRGNRNEVGISSRSSLAGVEVEIVGSDNRLAVGENVYILHGAFIQFRGYGCLIDIGRNTSIQSATLKAHELRSRLIIGEDCMVAHNVVISTSDDHPILEGTDYRRHNPAEDIIIGRHVWIGEDARLLKGTEIGSDCVVGAGAFLHTAVHKKDGELITHAIIIGSHPDDIKLTGIYWNRDMVYDAVEFSDEVDELLRDPYAQSWFHRGHIWLHQGMAYAEKSQWREAQNILEKAANAYRQALLYKPDYLWAYSSLGNAYRNLAKTVMTPAKGKKTLAKARFYLEQAIECYDQALIYNPSHSDSQQNRQTALAALEDL